MHTSILSFIENVNFGKFTLEPTDSSISLSVNEEDWFLKFKSTSHEYRVSVEINKKYSEVSIAGSSPPKDSELETRKDYSILIHSLIETVNGHPNLKVKMMIKPWKFIIRDRYLILDLHTFDERCQPDYPYIHKKIILDAFNNSLEKAKIKDSYRDFYLVIKEIDEKPLMNFLCEHNLMHSIAEYDGEFYLKLSQPIKICQRTFYHSLKQALLSLGYNLYIENQIRDRVSTYELSFSDGFDKWDEYDEYL